jgi:hypothetical protein
MTDSPVAPSMRSGVKADGAANGPNGVEAMLDAVRSKVPELWDRAAVALAAGQVQVAGLALRRRRVLLHELDNLTQLVASKTPHSRVLSRIKAADQLLDASLSEASRTGQPPPREVVMLDLDPAVQSDMRRMRAEIRNETASPAVSEDQEGGR